MRSWMEDRQRSGERAGATREASGKAVAFEEHPLVSLQRSAGNQAVTGLVAAARDSAAESEADRLALAAARALTTTGASNSMAAIAGGTGRLPGPLQAALRPMVGDTSAVGIHSGPDSANANDALGARAFARSGQIHLGAGERRSPDATELVLHEAVHAVRHDAGEGGAGHDAGGRALVHAKLRGTRDALLAQGGAKTSGFLRKMAAKMGAKQALTRWDQILSALAVYEEAEGRLVSGNPGPIALGQAKPKMIELLARIDAACLAWQSSNEGEQAEYQREAMQEVSTGKAQSTPSNDAWQNDPKDIRSKAPRRQAVAMLLPRIQREMEDWRADRWAQGLGLSGSNLTKAKEVKEKGQMSDAIEQVTYDVAGTSFKGFFKPEKGFEESPAGHDLDSGIRRADPNYGARAVAMHRLDQLLGTNVIARAEFAIHNGRLGVVTEKAKGTQASKMDIKISGSEGARTGAPSLEDPVLQSCFNKLQIIDAIAGQLDRHRGNYFVQTDVQGRVTGLTGIDLDMAFGQEMTDPSHEKKPTAAAFYKGVPTLVDYQLGQRLIQLTEDDVEGAIKGLLSDAEVAATKARFRIVRQHALDLANSGQLTQQWNAQTSQVDRPEKPSSFRYQMSDFKSYGADVANEQGLKVSTPARKAVEAAFEEDSQFRARSWYRDYRDDLEPVQRQAISSACAIRIVPAVEKAVMSGALGVDQATSRAAALVDEMFSDSGYWSKVVVATQENDDVGRIIAAKAEELLSARGGASTLVGSST